MARIVKTRDISFEQICEFGHIIQCEYDCKIGDIINDGFVYLGRTPLTNLLYKGDYTVIIPLEYIDIAETATDLSDYGFIKTGKINNENIWIYKGEPNMSSNKNKPNPNYVPPASVSIQQTEYAMDNDVNFLQQGWECPKCGAVMGPHVDVCVNCRGSIGHDAITSNGDWAIFPSTSPYSIPCSSNFKRRINYETKSKS